jgi:Skp family chaperone for outer membrane proteins
MAVVDMQGAILKTKDGQQAAAEIKAKFAPKEQEIGKRNQELVAKQTAYQKTGATMSDVARAGAERDIQAMQKALQRDTDDARADVQAEENRLLGGIMQKMQSVLQRYAGDHQYAVIIDTSQQPNNLVYADKSVNITLDVVAIYDKASSPMTNAPPASMAPPAAPAPKKPAGPPGKQEQE